MHCNRVLWRWLKFKHVRINTQFFISNFFVSPLVYWHQFFLLFSFFNIYILIFWFEVLILERRINKIASYLKTVKMTYSGAPFWYNWTSLSKSSVNDLCYYLCHLSYWRLCRKLRSNAERKFSYVVFPELQKWDFP